VAGRACRVAREERNVVQVKIAAAIDVNQATIAL
jgi:DNA-binding XRE family transcriptional regulator